MPIKTWPASPDARTRSLRLIHLSDPHLTTVPRSEWYRLFNKRACGYWAWRRKRRHLHRPEVLDALLEDMRSLDFDHMALTGDLTQVGLPSECQQALEWLQQLGPPERISVVPGNHDAYRHAPWHATMGLWQDYMSDESGQAGEALFPFVRYRGQVALIGVTTAIPTPWPLATGMLGSSQLARLEASLLDTAVKGYFRVLMIHHPPVAGMIGWRKRLTDTAALADVIRRAGVELVLHGHAHRALDARLSTPAGQAFVLGAPSASMTPNTGRDHAGYSIVEITDHAARDQAPAWSIKVTRRMIDTHCSKWHFINQSACLSVGAGQMPAIIRH
ncbi:metallophosphoesterase family protein [Halomonas ventosae]|uniref:3',5'-cyclic AMP phosphodiesterase CpdA n=1 Tax=Halomonas ventosae TaxID=229007 RepID=A0A4R6HGR0_9GAMM|nr:metallophosphoesterase [Halomonas ventosae]TDO07742.1 3',5'-cyclic AMP phosphodiesterase CpdA [Halomonas ventosae]